MKTLILILLLSFSFLTVSSYGADVTPAAILSGKYAKELHPGKLEYTQNVEKHKQAITTRKVSYRKLDSLAAMDILSLWPEEEQQRFRHIINLAKNGMSGDVYTYLKELGAEYAFTLNKVTNLNEVYMLERAVCRANNEIQETEEWAADVAEIARYWHEDFIAGTLTNDFFFYKSVLSIDKDIQKIEQKYQNNIGLLILDDEEKAKTLYFTWKNRKADIKQNPQREFLFMQLEKRFTRTFTD
jgi:Skp family chaperone for outer membrane proteins